MSITNRIFKKIKTREQGMAFLRETRRIQTETATGIALTDRLRQVREEAVAAAMQEGTPEDALNIARGRFALADELLQEGFGLIELMAGLGAEIDEEFMKELRAVESEQS
jgi:hypothetical protein